MFSINKKSEVPPLAGSENVDTDTDGNILLLRPGAISNRSQSHLRTSSYNTNTAQVERPSKLRRNPRTETSTQKSGLEMSSINTDVSDILASVIATSPSENFGAISRELQHQKTNSDSSQTSQVCTCPYIIWLFYEWKIGRTDLDFIEGMFDLKIQSNVLISSPTVTEPLSSGSNRHLSTSVTVPSIFTKINLFLV